MPPAPATPRRVTRSSSRVRPSDDSDDEPETTTQRRKSTTRKSTTASKSPAKKTPVKKTAAAAAAEAKKPPARGRSSSKKTVKDEEEVEEVRPRSRGRKSVADTAKSKSPSKKAASEKKATPEKKTASKSQPRSRSRGRKVESDSEDEEEETKPVVSRGKSPAKQKPAGVVRIRSRSRGRKVEESSEDSEDSETKKPSPKAQSAASPEKKKIVSPKSQDDDDDEVEGVMYRTKTPTVVVKCVDYFWLALIGFIPLLASALNMLFVSADVRQHLSDRCPKFALLNNIHTLPLYQVIIINFVLYMLTSVLIAFKLRKSSTQPFVTATITSMIFRGYVAGSILLTWGVLYFYKQQIPEIILNVISISLIASSAADLFYSLNNSSAARVFENVFSAVLSYYILFQAPYSQNEAVRQLAPPLLSSLVLYAIVAGLIAFGSVGVLSTSNTTHTSKTITAISHACIWLHTIVAILGPIFFFFKEVQQHLTINFTKPAIIARAVAACASVLLNFTSYADAVNVNLNVKKD